jgi:Domain of unknown function (DUF4218)
MELQRLRKKVGNKAHLERSMVEAYIIEDISKFCSIYFFKSTSTRRNQIPRHDDGGVSLPGTRASIFTHSRRAIGKNTHKRLDVREYNAAQLYVLLNCLEV